MFDLSFVNEKITEAYGWTAETLSEPVPIDDYGIKWPRLKGGADYPQWHKEAAGFVKGGLDGHTKLFHLVNMIKLDLPEFVFTSRGYINSECLRVLDSLCKYKDLGVAGAASSGKTYPIAAYRLQQWKASPHNTLTFLCTTSLGASEQRIWGAIVSMYQSSVYKIGTYIPHKHAIVFGRFSESADQRDFKSAIIALPIEKGSEGKKAVETTRGRKQDNVSVTFDELPEMEHYVTDCLINLESNENLEATYIGNSNNETDPHGNALRPDHPLGYKSINKNTQEWKTRTGHAIYLNGLWSANFQAPPDEVPPFKGITDRKKIARMLVRCHNNVNSIEFYRNAYGFWPTSSVSNTVLTKDMIVLHKADQKIRWKFPMRRILAGFDSGFSVGGDSCVVNFGELGTDEYSRKVLQWMREITYYPERDEVFEDSIARQLVNDLIILGVEPNEFGMDISSDGGKMMRSIIREWSSRNAKAHDIVPISSMGKPSDRIFSSVDPRPCSEVFDRRVTEYWMMVREGVACEVIKGIPLVDERTNHAHAIVEQLCTRQYEIRGKKFGIETKEDMKKRTQGTSPDNADSFCYLVEMSRRHGLLFITKPEEIKLERTRQTRKYSTQRQSSYDVDDWGERESRTQPAQSEW